MRCPGGEGKRSSEEVWTEAVSRTAVSTMRARSRSQEWGHSVLTRRKSGDQETMHRKGN